LTKKSESPDAVFHKTVWREIHDVVEKRIHLVREGRGRLLNNPFAPPGQSIEIGVTDAARVLATKLRVAGLHKDEEFLQALTQVFKEVAAAPIWGVMTALDGEGAWEGDGQYQLYLDGHPVDKSLHDSFHEYE
jgi:hypothetical protein